MFRGILSKRAEAVTAVYFMSVRVTDLLRRSGNRWGFGKTTSFHASGATVD